MCTYEYCIDILLLPPLEVELQLDLGLLNIKLMCLKEATIKVLVKHQLLYLIEHLVSQDVLDERIKQLLLLFRY